MDLSSSSTPFEFSNPTNSRKSLCSGIGVAAVAQFDHDLDSLLRRQTRFIPRIEFVGLFEAGKYPDRPLHIVIISVNEMMAPVLMHPSVLLTSFLAERHHGIEF